MWRTGKIKAGYVTWTCVIAILLFHQSGFGQEHDTAEAELNEALILYRADVDRLSQARGVNISSITNSSFNENDNEYLLNGSRPLAGERNISREDISAALQDFPEGSAVLFYSYKGDSLRMWLIDKQGVRAYHTSDTRRPELNDAMAGLRKSLRVDLLQLNRTPRLRDSMRPRNRNTAVLPLRRSASKLTRILLPAEIAEHLKPVKHLIIAPVMGIGTVPFAMLQPFGDRTCLIDKMSVSVVPSVYDILNPIEKWQSNFSTPLVVGNPYFAPSRTWEVPTLPGAEDEARYVGNVVNVKPLIGKNATKEDVIAGAKNADFLYFATHGLANRNDPLTGGFLLLSADQLERGLWTAKEIQDSKLIARIAVLSACQTGLGRVHDAGVIGLSRAFQIAGVPRVAMSLWSVDDKATSKLMKVFVDRLKDNVPSEAMRLAVLDLKKHEPNPTKWAAFVMFGTPR